MHIEVDCDAGGVGDFQKLVEGIDKEIERANKWLSKFDSSLPPINPKDAIIELEACGTQLHPSRLAETIKISTNPS